MKKTKEKINKTTHLRDHYEILILFMRYLKKIFEKYNLKKSTANK